jgi:hypothetical protein
MSDLVLKNSWSVLFHAFVNWQRDRFVVAAADKEVDLARWAQTFVIHKK